MKIAILTATDRGVRFIEHLARLQPDAELLVYTFKEEICEPPFVDDTKKATEAADGKFHMKKDILSMPPVDLLFAVSWRYYVPPKVYNRAKLDAYVFHDSLLPRYRGHSPSVWAIINGEERTGATLFKMTKGIDEGPMVDQQVTPIHPDATIQSLREDITHIYMEMLEHNLPALLSGNVKLHPQRKGEATYTCKRLPKDNRIDWNAGTKSIYNLVRATTRPYTGAFTYMNDDQLLVWEARHVDKKYVSKIPGRVVEAGPKGPVILTGDGAILLPKIQLQVGDTLK